MTNVPNSARRKPIQVPRPGITGTNGGQVFKGHAAIKDMVKSRQRGRTA